MKKEDENTTSRRAFIRTGALSLAGIACLSVGLKEALANARATGKVLLTEANLNSLFAAKKQSKQIKELVKEISRDIPGWLKREFSLTEVQKKAIDSIRPAQIAELKRVLKPLEKDGGDLTVKIDQREVPDTKRPQAAAPPFATCKGTVKSTTEGSAVQGTLGSGSSTQEASIELAT